MVTGYLPYYMPQQQFAAPYTSIPGYGFTQGGVSNAPYSNGSTSLMLMPQAQYGLPQQGYGLGGLGLGGYSPMGGISAPGLGGLGLGGLGLGGLSPYGGLAFGGMQQQQSQQQMQGMGGLFGGGLGGGNSLMMLLLMMMLGGGGLGGNGLLDMLMGLLGGGGRGRAPNGGGGGHNHGGGVAAPARPAPARPAPARPAAVQGAPAAAAAGVVNNQPGGGGANAAAVATAGNGANAAAVTVDNAGHGQVVVNQNNGHGNTIINNTYYGCPACHGSPCQCVGPVVKPKPNEPPVGVGWEGKVWGDPHFVTLKPGPDGKPVKFDIMPPPGKIVSVFEDSDLRINGKVGAWQGNPNATVFTDIGLTLGADRIQWGLNGGPTFADGRAVAVGETLLGTGSIVWDPKTNKLVFKTKEYEGSIDKANGYFDVNAKITGAGYRSDGVNPEGLLGGTAVRDITKVDPKTGEGALAPGTKLEDYYTQDLFSAPSNPNLVRLAGDTPQAQAAAPVAQKAAPAQAAAPAAQEAAPAQAAAPAAQEAAPAQAAAPAAQEAAPAQAAAPAAQEAAPAQAAAPAAQEAAPPKEEPKPQAA